VIQARQWLAGILPGWPGWLACSPFVVANNDSIAQRLNLFRRKTEEKAKDKLADL